MSLRVRLLAGLGVIALVLAVVLVVITRSTHADLVAQIDGQLTRAVGPGRGAIPTQTAQGAVPPLADTAEQGAPRQLSTLYVGRVDGDLVETIITPGLGTTGAAVPEIDPAEARRAALSGEAFTTSSTVEGVRFRVRADTNPVTGEVVVIALPLETVDDAFQSLVRVEIVGAVVILLVLGLVAWWVIRLGIRPVREMTHVASAIADGDLSHRVPDSDPHTEAGELGVALNRMLGNIEEAFAEREEADARLRRFVADASHELRTPVSTIRGYAELYRSGALEPRAELDDAMRRTEQEAIRMGGLVDDLLVLANLDERRPLERTSVDLSGVATDAGRDAAAVQPARPIDVHTQPGTIVEGDEAKIRQVVANVLGNALTHTPVTSRIEVRVTAHDGVAEVEVADEGPGMEPEAAARAFERFYRADPSRSRRSGGTGLGLAIVQSVVTAHGGTVTLESAPARGTTVRLRLPIGTDTDQAVQPPAAFTSGVT